jgi:hypothetical protein
LTIAADCNLVAASDAEDGGTVKLFHEYSLNFKASL